MRVVNPEVEKAKTEGTALMLMEAHAVRERFMSFAKQRGIEDLAGAYRVQDAFAHRQMATGNTQTAGFKIGLTTKKMQEMCGIDTPIAGYVAANRIYPTGAAIEARNHTHIGCEFEIAVKMGRDFPFRPMAYTQGEVATGIMIAPGIELVDDRNAEYAGLDVLSLIADNSWNAGIVVGVWREPVGDLAAVEGIVTWDGHEIGRGFGRDALGHPLIPLTWLANFRASTDRPLRKGDIVMTGSLIRTQFPTRTSSYHFKLVGVGDVDVDVRF